MTFVKNISKKNILVKTRKFRKKNNHCKKIFEKIFLVKAEKFSSYRVFPAT